jgi:hypothetical protein
MASQYAGGYSPSFSLEIRAHLRATVRLKANEPPVSLRLDGEWQTGARKWHTVFPHAERWPSPV